MGALRSDEDLGILLTSTHQHHWIFCHFSAFLKEYLMTRGGVIYRSTIRPKWMRIVGFNFLRGLEDQRLTNGPWIFGRGSDLAHQSIFSADHHTIGVQKGIVSPWFASRHVGCSAKNALPGRCCTSFPGSIAPQTFALPRSLLAPLPLHHLDF